MKDGKVVLTAQVQTTGVPSKVVLKADRPRIQANPSDVAHITAEVQDAEGRVVPTAENELSFTIQGAGRILGVDNGQPDSHESYKGNKRKAFNGMALVVLQPYRRAGGITLTASSPSLASAQVTVESN
jgi:beta-galactosidase